MERNRLRIVLGPRVGITLLLLFAVGIVFIVVTASGVQLIDRDRSRRIMFRTEEVGNLRKGSPHLQLVGSITRTLRYGVFTRPRGAPDASEMSITVVCRGGQYFAAYGLPRDYLRTLLRKEEFPELAEAPSELRELDGASDSEAMDSASEVLRKSFEGS